MSQKISGRKCQVTGKRSLVGNNVSHANNKTKTISRPNLQVHRFWVPSMKRWVRLKVSTSAMRTISKRGIDSVVAEMMKDGRL